MTKDKSAKPGRPYQCILCGAHFQTKKHVAQHIKDVHADELTMYVSELDDGPKRPPLALPQETPRNTVLADKLREAGSEWVTYVIMRRDLNMRRGKEIAQATHLARSFGTVESGPVIAVKAETEDALEAALAKAKSARLRVDVVRDAGRTEVKRGTKTCAAVYAPKGFFPELEIY